MVPVVRSLLNLYLRTNVTLGYLLLCELSIAEEIFGGIAGQKRSSCTPKRRKASTSTVAGGVRCDRRTRVVVACSAFLSYTDSTFDTFVDMCIDTPNAHKLTTVEGILLARVSSDSCVLHRQSWGLYQRGTFDCN